MLNNIRYNDMQDILYRKGFVHTIVCCYPTICFPEFNQQNHLKLWRIQVEVKCRFTFIIKISPRVVMVLLGIRFQDLLYIFSPILTQYAVNNIFYSHHPNRYITAEINRVCKTSNPNPSCVLEGKGVRHITLLYTLA